LFTARFADIDRDRTGGRPYDDGLNQRNLGSILGYLWLTIE
jgi:hypothetical protein